MSYVQRRRFLWALLLVALALLVVVANATTLARMKFEELARLATAVARVRCLGAKTFWENGEIWTETSFALVEQWKGSLTAIVTVRALGGTIGNLHSRVEDAPAFHAGEEAYLFLWGREGEPLRVLGWTQGTFRVTRDTKSGAELVTQDSSAVAAFDQQTQRFLHEGVRNVPVQVFLDKLKRALEETAR